MDGTAMATNYPDARENAVEDGLAFQDFVCTELAKHGLIIQNYSSKRYQYEVGENVQGFEIKQDRRCTDTQRLSIEIAEKTRADRPEWTPSGIMRDDNSWLYIQGNDEVIFVFAKRTLLLLYEHMKGQQTLQLHEEPKGNPTVRAFFLPLKTAERNAAKVIYCRH